MDSYLKISRSDRTVHLYPEIREYVADSLKVRAWPDICFFCKMLVSISQTLTYRFWEYLYSRAFTNILGSSISSIAYFTPSLPRPESFTPP